jgi:hypothetical protein
MSELPWIYVRSKLGEAFADYSHLLAVSVVYGKLPTLHD